MLRMPLKAEDYKAVTHCLVCETKLDKKHWRTLYCSKRCRNKAHYIREDVEISRVKMTPDLFSLLHRLRKEGATQRELRR